VSLAIERVRARAGGFGLSADAQVPLDGVTVVFGPSGAGKSTLLKTLAGLIRPYEGRITLDGQVLDDAKLRIHVAPHRRGVGLLFQDARLFPHLTVAGNLDFAQRRRPGGRSEAAQSYRSEIIRLLDIGDLIERPVRNLSGGEKSRVALARAALGAPRLLMLDEPFAALDGRRRRLFLALLMRLSRELSTPMMLVTHLVEDAIEAADHIIAMRGGEIVASGPAEAVAAGEAFHLLLDLRDLGARIGSASLALPGEGRAVWVRADSVLLATRRPAGLSARNVWPGAISSIAREDDGSSLVAVETSAGRIFSRITAAAHSELGLADGGEVWAIVKTHSL